MKKVIDLNSQIEIRECLDISDYFDAMEKAKYELSFLDMFFINIALLEEAERVIMDSIDGKLERDDLIQHFVDNASAIYSCYYSFFESYITNKDSYVSLSLVDISSIIDCISSSLKSDALIKSSCTRFNVFKYLFEDKTYELDYIMSNYLQYTILNIRRIYWNLFIDKYSVKLLDSNCINKRLIKNSIKSCRKSLINTSDLESKMLVKLKVLDIWNHIENPLILRDFCRDILVSKLKKIKDIIVENENLMCINNTIVYANEIESKYLKEN